MNWIRTFWWNRFQLVCGLVFLGALVILFISNSTLLFVSAAVVGLINYFVVACTIFGVVSWKSYHRTIRHLRTEYGDPRGKFVEGVIEASYCDSRGALMALKDFVGRVEAYRIYAQFKPEGAVW